MKERIFELLRKNKVGHAKAWYLTHELLRLCDVVGQSEQLICCSCKYPSHDVWYGTYCATCGFDLPKQQIIIGNGIRKTDTEPVPENQLKLF